MIQSENFAEKYIDIIQTVFNEIIGRYETAGEDLKNKTDEQEDIEHEIELAETDDNSTYWANELRNIRKQRRIAKNEVEILQELATFLDENKSFINKLTLIKGNVRKIYNAQQNRIYKSRVRKDLTITHENPSKNFVLDDVVKEFDSVGK